MIRPVLAREAELQGERLRSRRERDERRLGSDARVDDVENEHVGARRVGETVHGGRTHHERRGAGGELTDERGERIALPVARVTEETKRRVEGLGLGPARRRQTRVAAQAFGQRGDIVEEWAVEIDGQERAVQGRSLSAP